MLYKLVIILLLITSNLFPQTEKDSLNNKFNIPKLNSLKTDWEIINSPFLSNPISTFNSSYSNNPSLYSLYANSQINAGINFELKPDVMLKRFQLVNNWEAKKKYGVFAKYLGIAQFMGVFGLAVIHISKFHTATKGKVNLKNSKFKKFD